jgi:hypothetical protein
MSESCSWRCHVLGNVRRSEIYELIKYVSDHAALTSIGYSPMGDVN